MIPIRALYRHRYLRVCHRRDARPWLPAQQARRSWRMLSSVSLPRPDSIRPSPARPSTVEEEACLDDCRCHRRCPAISATSPPAARSTRNTALGQMLRKSGDEPQKSPVATLARCMVAIKCLIIKESSRNTKKSMARIDHMSAHNAAKASHIQKTCVGTRGHIPSSR